MNELETFRRRGFDLLIVTAWACVAALFAIGLTLGTPRLGMVIAIAILANVTPTLAMLRDRRDGAARLTLGTLAAVHPALGVYLYVGHPWQMDAHMYFFVALAALTVLCDWRPIVLASLLVAAHHLALTYLMPQWVFEGSGNLGRTMVHAIAVVLQCAVLSYLTTRLHTLFLRQECAQRDSEAATGEAIARRHQVEAAMTAAAAAERLAAAERDQRDRIAREAADSRRAEMLAVGDAFHETIDAVVGAVGSAARELEELARALHDIARRASRETAESAQTAALSSANADTLATRIAELSQSIAAIGASVDRQATLSAEALDVSDAGHHAVRQLADRTDAIGSFADSVHAIAARTKLLALNATIEAARAGDVGRGFAVVANEVKLLAGQASGATSEIRTLTGSVRDEAEVAETALGGIAGAIGKLAAAADAIRTAIEVQRTTAAALEATAIDTAAGATQMASQIGGVAMVAHDTETLADRVLAAASTLAETSRALDRATDGFVRQLGTA